MKVTIEPGTPTQLVRQIAFAGMGAHIVRPETIIIQREGWYQVITPTSRDLARNEIVHSVLDESDVWVVLARERGRYEQYKMPFKWCLHPFSQPTSAADVLAKACSRSWEYSGMYVNVSDLAVEKSDAVCEELSFENKDEFVSIFAQGWGQSPNEFERRALGDDFERALTERSQDLKYFLCRINGVAVGTAGAYIRDKNCYLLSASVIPGARGNGAYRALLDARIKLAKTRGATLLTTQARNSTSAPILTKLGFKTAYTGLVFTFGE